MRKYNISPNNYKNLKPLSSVHGINNESTIYKSPFNKDEIIKIFYASNLNEYEKYYLENKLYTVTELYNLSNKDALPFCVLPESLVYTEKDFKGYSMKYIKGNTASQVLKNSAVPFDYSISILKNIGETLQRLNEYRQENDIELFISDLHEDNILVTPKKEIKLIDMDSCKINGNDLSPSYYLFRNDKFWNLSDKYIPTRFTYRPNENTELYCYISIILNFLMKSDIKGHSVDDINKYLAYLDTLKVDSSLLRAFERIYTHGNNINPYNLLETLNNETDYSYQGYQRTLK